MNKQERDRLRELAQRDIQADGQHYYPTLFNPIEIVALLDHIDALEGLVEAGDSLVSYMEYTEAHGEGSDGTLDGCALCILIKKFRDSQAALTQAEEKGG